MLSVLNIGASVLTSHLSRILSRCHNYCHAPVTPSGGHGQVGEMERSGIAAVSVYTHSGPGERKESKELCYDVTVLDYNFTSQKLQWRDYWTE